jgi:hypothetical protein
MAREFLMVVEESAYLTPVSTPTVWTTATSYGLANAQAYYVRLDGGNAFTMRPRRIQVEVPYGGGVAIGAFRVSDKIECKGNLTMNLSIFQTPFWLSWAGVRISGGTSPWTTTEPNGDLPSCSIYHAISHDDGTIKRRVYLGCKVDSWSIAVNEAGTIAKLTLGLSGSTPQGNAVDASVDPTAGTFPSPAENNYPSDPYLFVHAGGTNYVKIGGTVRTKFTELTITSTNTLARRWYATNFLQILRFMGRKTTVATRLLYQASPDDRAIYEALTTEAVSIELSNATHSVIMDLKAQNVYDPFDEDLPLDDLYFFTMTEANLWDPTAATDFTLTFA